MIPFNFPLSLPTSQPLITLSYSQDGIWVIELHNGEDSRITASLINDALRPALDLVEKHWMINKLATAENSQRSTLKPNAGDGALIIVGKRDQDKFFSNGFVYDDIKDDPGFIADVVNPFLTRFLTFPIPTVAAINGHCFAAGCMLALCCDYRVMTDGSRRRAWLCMNEVHFGAPWPLSFTAILNAKVSDPPVRRRIALEGHRFTPAEALAAGIVDRLANCGGTSLGLGTEIVLKEAMKLAKEVSSLAGQGVWGTLKSFLYKDCLDSVGLDARKYNPPRPQILAKL